MAHESHIQDGQQQHVALSRLYELSAILDILRALWPFHRRVVAAASHSPNALSAVIMTGGHERMTIGRSG